MDIIEKSWEVQKSIEDRFKHLGKGKYGRVIKMARKPSSEEYIRIIQITGLGLIIIGGLGFLIYWIMYLLTG
ncbi:MAG: protein translocase SEC61 complex subunit gamma [Methanomassiliicoccales archaeon]